MVRADTIRSSREEGQWQTNLHEAKPFDNSHKPKIADEFQTSSCRPQSQKKRAILANLKAKDQDQVQPLETNPKYERIKIKVQPKA